MIFDLVRSQILDLLLAVITATFLKLMMTFPSVDRHRQEQMPASNETAN